MRRSVLRVLVGVPLILGACAPARTFAPTDRALVENLLRSQEAAWNRGDLSGYMAGYARSADLVFTSGGRIRTGWDETLAAYQKRYGAAPETMGHLGFEILRIQAIGADGAIVLGRWNLTETAQAGHGVFSVILERRAEGWRIVHDHTSVDAAP